MVYLYGIGFVVALIISILSTPLVKKFAFWAGAVDQPNARKMHTRIMPRLGGLAIFAAVVCAFFVVFPGLTEDVNRNAAWGLLIGGAMIVIIGALDDRFDLSPKIKLLGEIAAACVVISFGLKVEFINLPFGDATSIGWLSIPLTIFWIVGVTNAINLIDGLDGLAAGVSGIATATMLIMAIMMGNETVILFGAVLLGSIIGFLFFNFHPAKIFMGDSGALFLGFSLATLSILGFKQTTLVSFVVPLVLLGVPLSDTVFAIVRRWINKKPISVADKGHLHHCLTELGFSHRKTVLIIYAIAAVFGASAILLSQATLWLTVIVTAVLLLVMIVGAEAIGIVSKSRRPVLTFLQKKILSRAVHSNSRK